MKKERTVPGPGRRMRSNIKSMLSSLDILSQSLGAQRRTSSTLRTSSTAVVILVSEELYPIGSSNSFKKTKLNPTEQIIF